MKIFLYIFSFIIVCIAPFVGEIPISLKDILEPSSTTYTIFWDLRVSRVVLAFFVGGILALGGLIFKSFLKMI